MKAVIYARYSTDHQRGESIDAQVRICREYAAAHGLSVVGEYKDAAVSGKGAKTQKRREYQRMQRDSEKGLFDVILIHKYDRIARSLQEHVTLERKLSDRDVRLIAVVQDFGDTNESKIIKAVMWAMSEYYSDNLGDEVRKGHRENALKALHNGGSAPFGYNVVDRQYIINEFEAAYVRRMFDNTINRRGHVALIREMAAASICGRLGRSIKYPQIYEILRNEKYTGVYVYSQSMAKTRDDRRKKPDAIRIENAFPAIIDKVTFDEVQRIMRERKQTGKKGGYLCSGLVYCQCGAKMHAMSPTRKGHTYHYYACSAKCGAPTVKIEEVDAAAKSYLEELLTEENQQRTADALRAYQEGELSQLAAFYDGLKSQIGEKRRRYDNLMNVLSSGGTNKAMIEDITNEMAEIKDEIAALEDSTPPPNFTVEQVRTWLEAIKNAPDERAIHLFIERIDTKVLTGDGKKGNKKTEFKMHSALNSVLGENGAVTGT